MNEGQIIARKFQTLWTGRLGLLIFLWVFWGRGRSRNHKGSGKNNATLTGNQQRWKKKNSKEILRQSRAISPAIL
jgi:hypothetical protein